MLIGAFGPAAAADPTPSPTSVPEGQTPVTASVPTVHSEMLTEHAADVMSFVPGPAPQPIETPSHDGGSVLEEGGAGGIAGLPNGLSHEVFGYLPYWKLSSGTWRISTTTWSPRSRTSRSGAGRTERWKTAADSDGRLGRVDTPPR